MIGYWSWVSSGSVNCLVWESIMAHLRSQSSQPVHECRMLSPAKPFPQVLSLSSVFVWVSASWIPSYYLSYDPPYLREDIGNQKRLCLIFNSPNQSFASIQVKSEKSKNTWAGTTVFRVNLCLLSPLHYFFRAIVLSLNVVALVPFLMMLDFI